MRALGVAVAAMALAGAAEAASPMLNGLEGWTVTPLFTVGEAIDGVTPPGILDGIGAFRAGDVVRVLVNHELRPDAGQPYRLANGVEITGARVTAFDIDRKTRAIIGAGLAFDTVYDRGQTMVTAASQISEIAGALGFSRFCSGQGIAKGAYGIEDDLFLLGEETWVPRHPYGGSMWAVDVAGKAIWAVPAMGRGAWENATPLATGDPGAVAFLLGDDTRNAPLYLYVGEKSAGGFLDRNGLLHGKLYSWQADVTSPADFHGQGSVAAGRFVALPVREPDLCAISAFRCDARSYLDAPSLHAVAHARGAFRFSRPEDLATNPASGTQAVLASTGGSFSDPWGTLYLIEVDFAEEITARVTILTDGRRADPDFGVRNPDNLDWGDDGAIYVQEDRARGNDAFGARSGREASIWRIDPATGAGQRIAEVDRSVVAPTDATDADAGEIGAWETSGILDVTSLFDSAPGETLLIATVQAHGIRDGAIGGRTGLVEGGQLVLLSKRD